MAAAATPCWLSPRVVLYAVGTPAPALPPGGLALARQPGHAFGDGSHPTTRLCAGALDRLCRQRPGVRVLDVGTGSGVLARIARARGAGHVVATEIDATARGEAQAQAALDAHPLPIEFVDRPPDHWGPIFDLVVANILEGVLLQLAPALRDALAPDAQLLLSGFTPAQSPALRARFATLGLTRPSDALLDGWVLLRLARPG